MSSDLASRIVQHLRSLNGTAVTSRDIAQAVPASATAFDFELRRLVACNQVERIHSAEGHRYVLRDVKAKQEQLSLDRRVLVFVASAGKPVSNADICAGTSLAAEQVTNALWRLRTSGVLACFGRSAATRWIETDAPEHVRDQLPAELRNDVRTGMPAPARAAEQADHDGEPREQGSHADESTDGMRPPTIIDRVYAALRAMPKPASNADLRERTGLPAAKVNSGLCALRVRGKAVRYGENTWSLWLDVDAPRAVLDQLTPELRGTGSGTAWALRKHEQTLTPLLSVTHTPLATPPVALAPSIAPDSARHSISSAVQDLDELLADAIDDQAPHAVLAHIQRASRELRLALAYNREK